MCDAMTGCAGGRDGSATAGAISPNCGRSARARPKSTDGLLLLPSESPDPAASATGHARRRPPAPPSSVPVPAASVSVSDAAVAP
jgi:hypothetical protein